MATENKTSPIRKLKSMYPLRAKVDESYRKSAEAVAAGKPVVWSMANWWQGSSILKALDLEVLYPENYGAVCAATDRFPCAQPVRGNCKSIAIAASAAPSPCHHLRRTTSKCYAATACISPRPSIG